jgi:VWFA-related protein
MLHCPMAGRTALLLALLLFPQIASAQDPKLKDEFGEEITVSLISMTVRAVDGRGRPITGLGPEDFRVRVGKKEIPVVGVDWFSSAEPAPAVEVPRAEDAPTAPIPEPRPAGKLVVFWVQADFDPSRVSGQLRLWPYIDEFIQTLHPADRMAVISYDSHLHLRQDFTQDLEAVHAAVYRGMLHGDSETGAGSGDVSLTGSFDVQAAVAAASPERALEVTAEALAGLPGEKIIVYLGWGLGRFGSFGVQMTPAFYPAVRALRRANIPVFVLDVTSADYHSLEVGLEAVAHATGGTYQKTHVLTGLATDFLAQAISGHYVITIDPDTVPRKGGPVTVELRDRKKGSVITRPLTLR